MVERAHDRTEERTAVARQLLGRQRTRRSVEALVHPAVVGRQQCEVRLQTQSPGRLLAAHIVAPQRRSIQRPAPEGGPKRSEEHTYELQSLMRHSYAVFC